MGTYSADVLEIMRLNIVPDEDMEEEVEAEEEEEVQEGEEEDAPTLSINDGGEIDCEPTPAGKAGTSGGYRLNK